ncbi:MAG TPA: 3'-5' exonuclease [Methylotenera sp.]|jgi:inhibitor of KinA sporulation pathway (predicted exonuclease)
MADNKYDEVIVIDLESTCWETRQEQYMNYSEIIEIGVCRLNVLTSDITDPRSIIVKPMFSEVSAFCTELTGHTQEGVDQGISLMRAIEILKTDYGFKNKMWASYGNYDRIKLIDECERKNIERPLPPTHLNISALATLKLRANKRVGLGNACARFGFKFEGRQHSGMDDAVMAAKVLWECIK